MSDNSNKIDSDRQILKEAQEKGGTALLGAFVKLSGPGWLQSAITLGGGSLAGALFLGVLGGFSLLWLQLMAIFMGVVMLSAISYVTLSTGQRPFQQINQHINPMLGWGWLVATAMANMIWCMPQFSLCYAALEKNFIGKENLAAMEIFLFGEENLAALEKFIFGEDASGHSLGAKLLISAVLLVATGIVVLLNTKQGAAAKFFDIFLKVLIGIIVLCFFGVVIRMGIAGDLAWGEIARGFRPSIDAWSQPAGKLADLIRDHVSGEAQGYWSNEIVTQQRSVMIASAATAVGINMTFLLPYSMLARGWDKPFRGLARFDLSTGMAIPYILVTSCVVIASASQFHAIEPDAQLLSKDPAVMAESDMYGSISPILVKRVTTIKGDAAKSMSDEEIALEVASLSDVEKQIGLSLVKRNAFQLSSALAPLLGEKTANIVFGIGIFGMGFSTIIILMLINGYVFTEMIGAKQGGKAHIIGCLVAGISGAAWPLLWDGDAKLWLAILTSSFGMMLLPIAYVTFFLMMNSKKILGENKPTGLSMLVWNVLMIFSVIGATIAAGTALYDKVMGSTPQTIKYVLIGVFVVYVILVIAGFFMKKPQPEVVDADVADAE
ncbi:MAG: divalent metal cation transporter [Pirellulales bacterium]